jgi:hypothetical protein
MLFLLSSERLVEYLCVVERIVRYSVVVGRLTSTVVNLLCLVHERLVSTHLVPVLLPLLGNSRQKAPKGLVLLKMVAI